MNLILLEPSEIDATGHALLSDERGAHIAGVLHATVGQQVRVGLLDGPYGVGTVAQVAGTSVTVHVSLEAQVPARPRVDVLLALPRPKVLRRLWSQLAALGVGRVVLTNASRVERDYFDAHVLQATTYLPLLKEGLQQAQDTRLPLVSVHRRLKVLIEDELDALCPDRMRLVADPGGTDTIRNAVGGASRTGHAAAESDGEGHRLLLAIGPEGGWSTFELALLSAHGFRAVGLGPRTLRTDTATVALLALAHEALASTGVAEGLASN